MIQSYDVKEIITDLNELGEWSEVIDPRKEGKLCQQITGELKATMRANDLIYLTAPQIGYKRRIFCVKFGKNDYRTFINPSISNNVGFTFARETCASIPGKTYIRPRFNSIEIIYYTPMGKIESRKVVGLSAQIINHCVDHLDGLILSDIGLEIDEMFDNATDEEREEVLRAYMDALDLQQKALDEEIKNNEELSKLSEAVDFLESVRKGETIIEPIYEEKSADSSESE